MQPYNLLLVVSAVILTFTAFYAPQPLLPLLAAHYQISESAVALLISVTMLPLSIAPIAYGFLLQSVKAKHILVIASAGLALTSFMLATGPGYYAFLVLRLLQGLLLPAMMTALMTYVATTAASENLSRAMARYVAMTVAGGFLGRAFSGQVTELVGWQSMFGVLGLLLALLALGLCWLKGEPTAGFGRLRLRELSSVLRIPGLVPVYITIFCAFFVFASLLNYLPFRLAQISGEMGPGRISLMYSGYLMGIVVALGSGRLVKWLASEQRAVLLGLGLYVTATLLFLLPSVPLLFATMFLFCAGMFTIHSVLPGIVNRLAPAHRSVVNGLYISAYYLGGVLGSFLPGYLLRAGGWSAFLVGLVLVLFIATAAVFAMHRSPRVPSAGPSR